ncbi:MULTISPECIES: TrkA family potassium uptake protein [unclassified Dehalobacter]|jgi:K+ transport systems, NAD-binding component|uniref:potassium channel family protein n=1 Tax=unclassified Dehalobacter TaxID=2635733 RepID=UPI00028B3CAB|nr:MULTISPECIES: TrkA family potassium uptake protein [unclassified Dehalobacter]AFV01042.1 Potassium uptake protein, integral membrane component, KtrA [Dehalobacter sp. DCA]AFV04081.1 Potassium uptake protein, integral membrane component, KtrA [Dehalobacter sp. CF]
MKKDKQFVVIGIGRFGKSVATSLYKLGYEVLVIDNSEKEIQDIANQVTQAVQLDARDEEALKRLGIRNFDVAIVGIGDDIQSNILVSVLLKELGVQRVVAKAKDALHGRVLEKIGVDRVIYPERDMGIRVAHNLTSTNDLLEYIELSPDYSIIEVYAPREFVDKTIGKLNLRATYQVSVIAIKSVEEIIAAPGAEALIKQGDILVVIGSNQAISNLPK